jgi:tetratricopeptide (TPR) repeat protein
MAVVPEWRERPRSLRRWQLVATLLLVVGLVGCDKFQARVEMKKAIAAYKEGHYRVALEQYQKGLALDPSLTEQWRSVGYSAIALYHPGDGNPENQALARTAIEAFDKYLAVHPGDAKVAEYITGLLIDAGRIDDALARLREEAAAGDPERAKQANRAVASLLVRNQRLDEAWEWANRAGAPADHAPLLTIGVHCWNAAYRDPMLDETARSKVVDRGLEALRKVVELAPTVPEGATYLNLMLREKAKLTLDPVAAQELYQQAEDWRRRAQELMRTAKPPAA